MSAGFDHDQAKAAFKEALEIERELRSVLREHAPFSSDATFLLQKLRSAYENVVFLDFSFAQEQDVEDKLWLKVHYRVIEDYRKRISKMQAAYGKTRPVELRKLTQHYLNYIKNATKFYRSFFQRLVSHFGLDELSSIVIKFGLSMDNPPISNVYGPEVKVVVRASCQRTLIILGDMSRYRELQSTKAKDWSPANGYYSLAQRLCPENGQPLNQMAVLATYEMNVVSVAHYFYRALAVRSSFAVAKDNLELALKKFVRTEKTDAGEPVGKWLKKEDLPVEDLLRLFLGLHAACYLGTNVPNFQADCQALTHKLEKSLRKRSLTRPLLTKMITINIAALYVAQAGPARSDPVVSHLRELNFLRIALDCGCTLFGVLIAEIVADSAAAQPSHSCSGADFAERITAIMRRSLPAMRLTSKWLLANHGSFVRYSADRNAQASIDRFWETYDRCMNLLAKRFPPDQVPVLDIPLREDVMFAGFAPLGATSSQPQKGKVIVDLKDDERFGSVHPNEEMLFRIMDILKDAKEISSSQQYDSSQPEARPSNDLAGVPYTSTPTGDHTPPPPNFQTPSFYGNTPSINDSDIHNVTGERMPPPGQPTIPKVRQGAPSVASESSMAFSVGAMVDNIVGSRGGQTPPPPDEKEEIVFGGRHIRPVTARTQHSPTQQEEEAAEAVTAADLLARVLSFGGGSSALAASSSQPQQPEGRDIWNAPSQMGHPLASPALPSTGNAGVQLTADAASGYSLLPTPAQEPAEAQRRSYALPLQVSSITRTLSNLRKIGLKDFWHQLNYIGDTKAGTLVGIDRFGNKYYENIEELPLRDRWVDYASPNFDAAQIEPGWHAWMSRIVDVPPTQDKMMQTGVRKWEKDFLPNVSMSRGLYKPYATVKRKYQAWEPKVAERV